MTLNRHTISVSFEHAYTVNFKLCLRFVFTQETPPMESDLPLDFNSIKEEEFDKFVDYIVLDQPPDPNNPNRAESSLPRNLKLKKIGKKVKKKN